MFSASLFSVSLSLPPSKPKLEAMASDAPAQPAPPPRNAIVTEPTFVVSSATPVYVPCTVLTASSGLPMVRSGSFPMLFAVPLVRQNQVLSTAVLRRLCYYCSMGNAACHLSPLANRDTQAIRAIRCCIGADGDYP